MRDERDKNATRVADLKRVDEIIKRSTALWIGLLGALVFASVTLAGVKDIAFFNPKVGTQLPFTGVAVPVVYFFYGGSLLIAVVYIYLHIYLEQLWDILGKAPALVDGRTLSERLHPWLVADFALRWRDRLRKTPKDQRAAQRRALSSIADFAAVLLVWLFTPAVLVWFWWRSMPAHDPWMTGLIGACLLATIYVGVGAYASARVSLNRVEEKPRNPRRPARWVFGVVLPVVAVITVLRAGIDPPEREMLDENGQPIFDAVGRIYEKQSWGDYIVSLYCPWMAATSKAISSERSQINWAPLFRLDTPRFCNELHERRFEVTYPVVDGVLSRRRRVLPDWLLIAPAALEGEVFSDKPKDWLGFDFTKAEFKAKWCQEKSTLGNKCPSALVPDDYIGVDFDFNEQFEKDWRKRRTALLGGLTKVNLTRADLRRANLQGAKLEGVNIAGAVLHGANLLGANLEGANLNGARLQNAMLVGARLEGADLRNAQLYGAHLSVANIAGANLSNAHLKGADLSGAHLEGTDLSSANLRGSNLFSARLEWANLSSANLGEADLTGAFLSRSNLSNASLDSAKLGGARLDAAILLGARLEGADLTGAWLVGANLGGARLNRANLNRIRLEGAVLNGSIFEDADLRGAHLEGVTLTEAIFKNANLRGARLFGKSDTVIDISKNSFKSSLVGYAGFRFIDMRNANLLDILELDSSFGDGTVEMKIGELRPCQWADIELSEEEFLGRWKGWLLVNELRIAHLDGYKSIEPPSYCIPLADRRDRQPPPSPKVISP